MLYRLARTGFFQLDAEKAHDLAIQNFKRFTGTPFDLLYRQQLPHRPVECMGLTFRNPVGLAAGLDKNGECIEAFDAMGFGFVEVGPSHRDLSLEMTSHVCSVLLKRKALSTVWGSTT